MNVFIPPSEKKEKEREREKTARDFGVYFMRGLSRLRVKTVPSILAFAGSTLIWGKMIEFLFCK